MTTNMNIIDITNDVTEIKEDNTITENTNMTTIEKETTVDEAFAEAVSLIPEELIEVEDGKQFERSSETVTIKTLINRYKKGTIQIQNVSAFTSGRKVMLTCWLTASCTTSQWELSSSASVTRQSTCWMVCSALPRLSNCFPRTSSVQRTRKKLPITGLWLKPFMA